MPTDGNTSGNFPTLPTPDPDAPDQVHRDPLDLRFELEEFRVKQDLVEEPEPVYADEAERYRLVRPLGQGAMGSVYLAKDTELGREVAVKVVLSLAPGRALLQERLAQEARALARVKHTNVVSVYDVDTAPSGERVVTLEYIEGQTLRAWQRGRRLREVIDAYLSVGRGLAAAHDVGVVHRDFKPDNAMVESGGKEPRVVVVDFGLAGGAIGDERASEGLLSPLWSTGLGTPEYMAPEQHRQLANARCDQYAYCIALWEAVDGERPFDAGRRETSEFPRAPARMPAWVYGPLRRGLSWDPARRYPDMHSLVRALERGRQRRKILGWGLIVGLLASSLPPIVGWLNPPCAHVQDELEQVWNPEIRDELERAFEQLDTPWAETAGEHALATLDEVTAAWSSQAMQVCQAKLERGSSPVLERQEACLSDWLERVDRQRARLERGDRSIADNLVATLGPLTDSAELCRLPPPSIDAGVRRLLLEAEDLEQQREFSAARDRAQEALQLAERAQPCPEATGHSFEAAVAHHRLAHALGKLGRWQESRTHLGEAARHGQACDDPHLLYDTRVYESFVHARGPDANLGLARARLDDAANLLERVAASETGGWRRAEQWRMQGLLLAAGSKPSYDQALDALTTARHMLQEIEPQPLARLVQVDHNLGTVLQKARRLEEAEQAYASAAALLGEAVGAEHPETLRAHAHIDVNSGLIALDKGELDRAEELLARAADVGDPIAVVRASSALLQTRYLAGQARESIDFARDFDRWVQRHPDLSPADRASAAISIGQFLTQAARGPGGVEDAETFELGLQRLREGSELGDAVAPGKALVARYNLAVALYQAKRYEEVVGLLAFLASRESELGDQLAAAVSDLRGKNETKLAGADPENPD